MVDDERDPPLHPIEDATPRTTALHTRDVQHWGNRFAASGWDYVWSGTSAWLTIPGVSWVIAADDSGIEVPDTVILSQPTGLVAIAIRGKLRTLPPELASADTVYAPPTAGVKIVETRSVPWHKQTIVEARDVPWVNSPLNVKALDEAVRAVLAIDPEATANDVVARVGRRRALVLEALKRIRKAIT